MFGSLTLKQREEVELLRKRHKTLNPAAVVAFAANPKTALHDRFTWDDSAAAAQYRLWQARQVLRISVFTPEGSEEPVRMFVSLRDDRNADGGYRGTADVLSDTQLREKMLAEALDELRVFERKYRILTDLAPVFAAAARVRRRNAKASPGHNGRAAAKAAKASRRKRVAVPA